MEDGYSINRQYDCIDRASFEVNERQLAGWKAANTPEAIAQRGVDFAAQRERYRGNTTAGAQLLWPGVEFGMPLSDVLQLVPGSQEDRGNVTLKGFRFAEKKFDVQFSFQSDRLVQVHLGDTVFMEPNAAVRSSFDRLVATLRQTYGEPSSQNIEEPWSGLRGEAIWRTPGSEITVTISPVTKDQSMILFNFFSRN